MTALSIIPHSATWFDAREEAAVTRVLRSGHTAMGGEVTAFQQALASLAKRRYATCVDSGFSALRLALLALGITTGDRVAIPAYGCVALANAVLSLGGVPVAIDTAPRSNLIDSDFLCATPDLKAAIIVHLFGERFDVAALKHRCPIPIVEDCAHALGDGFGQHGNIAIGSFYATKLIGIGEGGVILTDDAKLHSLVTSHASYVDQPASAQRFNHKMTDIEAAIGLCQLEKLADILQLRSRIARRYDAALRPLAQLALPDITADRLWYRYAVRVAAGHALPLKQFLNSKGIGAECPVEPWGAEHFATAMPHAIDAYACTLSLPIYPALGTGAQQRIIAALHDFAARPPS